MVFGLFWEKMTFSLKCFLCTLVYDRTVQYGTAVQYGNFGLFGYGRTRTGTAKNNGRTPYYFVASVFGKFSEFYVPLRIVNCFELYNPRRARLR